MTWIRDHVKPGMSVVDIGANGGQFTKPLADRVGPVGRVYAIEPHAEHLQTLLQIGQQVRVITVACGDRDAPVTFYRSHETVHGTLYPENVVDLQSERLVPMRRLDSLELGPIDAIKIDAQGAEYAILRGGEELIGQWRPVLFLEIWPMGLANAGSSVNELAHFLEARQYTPSGHSWAEVYAMQGYYHGHGAADVLFLPPGKVAA